jgi:hypothetical protein
MKNISNQEKLLAVFVIFAAFLRVIPHPLNFTPVTSLALFSGVMFSRKWMSVGIPLVAMILSDMVLGFYSISLWVYIAFISITIFGWFINKMNINSILLSSIIFFIISNFGVWLLGYPHTIEGLILCYTMAIPFFGYSIIGDLFWGMIIKYSFKFIQKKLIWIF